MNSSNKIISMLFASSLIVACGGSSNDDNTDPVDPTPTPVNSTGQVSISGTPQVGEVLTASVADTNGLSTSTIAYQWRIDGVDIAGATNSSYTLTSAEEGRTLSVMVIYTDDDNFGESIESAPTSTVAPIPATNITGSVTISGTTQVGQTLNATVSDSNGTSNSTITYQWLSNGNAIIGATTGSLALTDAQLGQTISVEVSYVDDDGFSEDLTSQATQAINAAPTPVEGGGNFTRGTVGDNDSVPAVTCDTVFTSTSQLEDAATREMTPGTTLCLADGTYSGLELDFGGTGTADALITVAAENPGEVIVNGEVGVRMSGDYVVLQGFIFMDGESASSDFLQTRGGNNEFCHNCRVTEIAVINLDENDPDSRGRWIHIYGTHNRVDHSWFSGKRTGAPLLAVNREIPNDGGLDDVAENFHMIDHNYFGDRPPTDGKAYASTSDNEFEGVQIGTSDAHDRNSSTTVAHNYFERIDGEAEVISNKSSNNTIFNNTVRDSYGSITNRHGNTTTISNNFVIGDGHPFSGGLRIVDDSHTIVNNYIEGARFLNTRFHGGIVLHNTDGSTTNGYQVFENVLVANNTVVDSVNSLNVNGGNRNTEPTDVRFVNNIIDNAVGEIIRTEGEGMPADSVYAGNFVEGLTFSDDDSLTSFSGFTQTTIELQDDVLGIARPTASSEALIAADNSADLSPFTSPTEDIDGHTRSDISTSGADEISDDAVVYGILNANDVGPISFRPPITEAIIRRVDVTNGGFDAGEQGWVFEGSAEVTDDPDQIFARGASAQVADVSDRISQTVTVEANTNYALTAFTRGPVSLGADIDGTEETGDFNNSEYRLSQFEFNSGNATQVTLFGTLDGFVENNVDIEEANFSSFDSSASDDNPWIILEGSAIPGGGQVQRSGNSASGADGSARFRYNDETESGSPMMSQILSDIAPGTDYELSLFVLADDSVTGTVAITDTETGVEITSKLLDFAALVAADAPRADDSFREDTLSFNSGSSSSITLSITYTANTIIPDGRGDREDTDLRIDDITITFLGAPNDGDEGLIDEMRLVSFPSN